MIIKFFVFILISSTFVDATIVQIDDGQILGTIYKSRLGVDFHAFFRIPYAAPPIGSLRFKAPQPVKKWNGTLDGTKTGNVCFQPRTDGRMSEDCLQLNVYSKNLTASKPVIFFIHGGGLVFGSGIDQGPQHMMDRDVVVVIINYRLGALGFLSLGSKEVPGNAGMKDQVMALQWVNTNIHKFGGNKNLVTIVGQSAGAVSVTAHMASSMSKGLFHRAIAISGAVTLAMPLPNSTIRYAEKVGEKLNCTGDLLQCLVKAEPSVIVKVDVAAYKDCQIITWGMVIENDFNQTRFFTEEPSETFQNGNFNKVPLIIGRTNDEFINPVPAFLLSPGVKTMNQNFTTVAPYCFGYFTNEENQRNNLSLELKKVFLRLNPIDFRSFSGLGQLFSDGNIGYPIHKLVQLVTNQIDVFYYKFTYIGRFGYSYPGNKPYGVCHSDDLNYSFFTGTTFSETDPENFIIERMTKIFEKFALSGDPNCDLKSFNWLKHDLSKEFYMDIGNNMVEKNGMFLDRYTIWDDFLPS